MSHEVFQGFQQEVNVEQFNSKKGIIGEVVAELARVLKSNNLVILEERLKKEKESYHIHGFSFENIVDSNNVEIFWICSHC